MAGFKGRISFPIISEERSLHLTVGKSPFPEVIVVSAELISLAH